MCLQFCAAEVLQTLNFTVKTHKRHRNYKKQKAITCPTLHKKKKTVQSHGCNEYINIRKDVQIKLYKMGPNLRTSFVGCVVSPVSVCYSYLFYDMCVSIRSGYL